MKKLMTMIAAVATAFGLYAAEADIAGINSFDALDAGIVNGKFTLPTTGWSFTGTDTEFALGEYNGDAYAYPKTQVAGNIRRTEFPSTENVNYLKLETGKEVLSLAAKDTSIFADQVVKFTGFEEAPELAVGTKIAVWMSEEWNDDDTVAETNLYVSAFNGTEGAETYKVDGTYELGKWYRLTIKNVGDILKDGGRLGFVVFIDGVPASSEDAKNIILEAQLKDQATIDLQAAGQLFPAITTDATFASVGYMGIGSVDDVVVDNQGPEFARSVDVSFAAISGATIAKVVDSKGNEFYNVSGTISVAQGNLTVTLAPAAGWKLAPGKGTYVVSTLGAKDGVIEIPVDEGDIIEGYAQVVNAETPAVTNIYGEAELEAMIEALDDGDTATFLQDSYIGDDQFGKDTTIEVADGDWVITAVGDLGLYSDIEKNIVITSEGDVYFASAIAAGKTVDATAVTGSFSLDGDIEVEGTLKVSDAFSDEGNQITLGEAGKVWSAEPLDTSIFTEEVDEKAEDDGYAYTLKTEPETGFMVIIAAGGTKGPFDTLAEAVEAASEGDTVQLLDDQTVTGICAITKSITLDLNGNTLSKDTTEVNYKSKMIVVQNGATLTVDGTDEGSTVRGGIYAGVSATSFGSIIVNGGTYYPADGKADCALSSNGNAQTEPGNSITINDATVSSPNDIAIYLAGLGTYEINNSTVTGYTAIYQKAGTLTIDATSVITATGDTYVAPKSNTNGAYTTGDAIVLDSNAAYAGAVELTIASGATVTKEAEGAAVIRETVTSGNASATLSIDPGDVTDIAVTDSFAKKVAAGGATLVGDFVAVAGGKPYTSLNDAFAAATDGTTITMLDDVTLSARIFVKEDITLDLAGKKIEWDTAVANKSGVLIVCRDAELTIDDSSEPSTGVIDAKGEAYAAVALTHGDDPKNIQTDLTASLVVNGGKLNGNYQGIVGNGNRPNTYIEVNGGEITATFVDPTPEQDGVAIYNPQANSQVVINGGYIHADASAIEIRAGQLTVTGGTLESTAESFVVAPNGNGSTTIGAAVAVAQHTTTQPIIAAITGGTLDGFYSVAVTNPQKSPEANVSVALGKDATYSAPLYFSADENATVAKDPEAQILPPEGYRWNENDVLVKLVTATFVADEKTVDTQVIDAGTAPTNVVVTKEGYNFLGWEPEIGVITVDTTYTAQFELAQEYGGGSGTEADPFIIETKAHFEELQTKVANNDYAGKFFKLVPTEEITLEKWTGIGENTNGGSAAHPFAGTFNGNGAEITVKFSATKKYLGLFNLIANGAVVSNLTINASLDATTIDPTIKDFGFAALAGRVDTATIENVTVEGSIGTSDTPATHNAAAMIVFLGDDGAPLIKDCVNNAKVYCSKDKVGGIVGFANKGNKTFVNCVNNGAITATGVANNGVAGIVGFFQGEGTLSFENCENTGAITGEEGSIIGSFVGKLNSNKNFVTGTGTNTAKADILAVGKVAAANTVSDFQFATVERVLGVEMATFIADDALEAGTVTYKVMAPSVTPTYVFTEKGSISFDTNLVKVAGWNVTAAVGSGLEVKDTQADGIVTWTAAVPGPVYPDDWPKTDDATKAKFLEWAAGKGDGADLSTDAAKNAFLLNCAVDDLAAEEAAFKITKIEKVNGEWVITVKSTNTETEPFNGAVVTKAFSAPTCAKAEEVTPAGTETELFWKAFLVFPAPAAE